MRTISQANVGSGGPFSHMSFPKSFHKSPPKICPKSVLKIVRLDSSFAKYIVKFCVTLLITLIVIKVSLWLFFFLYESTRSFQNVSYGGIQSRFKIVGLRCFG